MIPVNVFITEQDIKVRVIGGDSFVINVPAPYQIKVSEAAGDKIKIVDPEKILDLFK